jgi:hypothetical protein
MKRVIRLTESDLIRLVKRIIKENEEEYLYHDPSSMGSGKWYRNTFMNQGEPEEYPEGELDIEDYAEWAKLVDDGVIDPRYIDNKIKPHLMSGVFYFSLLLFLSLKRNETIFVFIII